MRLPQALRRALYAITRKALQFYPRDEVYLFGHLPLANRNYQKDVREGLDSNVIMAPVAWVMRTFTEARPVVQTRRGSGIWEIATDHPLEALLAKPNPFYDGDSLMKASALSYILGGDGYNRKVRNAFGEPVELWYMPHFQVTPRSPADGSVFLSHYDYTINGRRVEILPDDVVHYRFGLEPRDPRHGYGCLRPLMREVFSDEQAAAFSANILENMGVPGLIVSPKIPLTPKQVTEFAEHLKKYRGRGQGESLVTGFPADTTQFGFDPGKLMLPNLRDITEERVCAMLGIPAAVVGFGSGLQSTKVGATMRELRQMAWNNCLIPMQKAMARQLTAQLLPDFNSQTRQFRVHFDMSEVSAFQEEKTEMANRAATLVGAGILRRDRAQAMLGLEVDPTCQDYVIPSGVARVDKAGNPIAPPEPPDSGDEDDDEIPAAVAARRNGNNGRSDDE